MSYNGSGTFVVNSAGQPVVTGTVISSTAFNALTADLATGLSTAITKDGQTTTTARILFAQGVSSTLVTDATSATTGSIITAGGISMQKALWVGTTTTLTGTLTAAAAVFSGVVDFDAANAWKADSQTTGATYAYFANTGGTLLIGKDSSAGAALAVGASAYASVFNEQNARSMQFATSNTVRMTIDSSGNLGIGTASPISNAGYGGLSINGTTGVLVSLMTNGTESSRIASIGNETSIQSKATTGYITFVQGVSSGTEYARFDTSGNLNIGTATSGSQGDKYLTIYGANNPTLSLRNAGSGTGNNTGFDIFMSGGSSETNIYVRGNAAMKFGTNNTEKARFGTDGSFGVGSNANPSPAWSATSTFWGTGAGNTAFGSGAGAATFFCNNYYYDGANGRRVTTGSSGYIIMQGDATYTISCATAPTGTAGGTVTAVQGPYLQTSGTNWTAASDARLKDKFIELSGALAKIEHLTPGSYTWNGKQNSPAGVAAIGLRAQEVYAQYPEIVSRGDDGDVDGDDFSRWGVEESKFGVIALAGVKELIAEIEALKARVAALEVKVN